MASTFKTEKLALNVWANTDKPVRSDFNRDNTILDSTVGGHIESTLLHLTDSDRSRLRNAFIFKILQGTDEETREITLDFEPSAVIYYAAGMPPAVCDNGSNKVYFASAVKDCSGSGGIRMSGSRVLVNQKTINSVLYELNNSDCQYVLFALR